MKRASRKRLIGALKDDRGAAALVIAAVIALVAFIALTVYLDKFTGGRTLARLQSSSSSGSYLVQSVFAAYLKSTTTTLPCPDTATSPSGSAGSCNSSAVTVGVLPWKDLGLSQDDVVDPYGDYYTYVVSHDGASLCKTVKNDVKSTSEYTGSLPTISDLTLITPTLTRTVAFAIIGHGANKKGAKSRNSPTSTSMPAATNPSDEYDNTVPSSPATIHIDNYSSSFDDVVYAPSTADMEKICKSLIPNGGQLNAQLAENFDSPAERSSGTPDTTTKFGDVTNTTVAADTRTTSGAGNYVAVMSATAGAHLSTSSSNFNFDPTVRPLYVSAVWTPNPTTSPATTAASFAGMSIATRATLVDLPSGGTDDFTTSPQYGITFRFFCGATDNAANGGPWADATSSSTTPLGANISAAGTDNYISIRSKGSALATSNANASFKTFKLKNNTSYIIEAYDDGTHVWGRITEQDDLTNTAYVSTTTSDSRAAGDQQVALINHTDGTHAATSFIDDLTIGVPMLALETTSTASTATSYASSSVGAVTIPSGTFTLEAWVRPRVLPTGVNCLSDPNTNVKSTIVSLWDPANGGTDNAFRLYMDSAGALYLDLAGSSSSSETCKTTGIVLKTNTWTHIAVAVDASAKTVSYYQDGVLTSTGSTAIAGVNTGASEKFTVGADADVPGGTTVYQNGFSGDVSDLRLWGGTSVRTAAQILANFEQRLPLTVVSGTTDNLVLNWKFDQESGGIAATKVTSTGTAAATQSSSFVSASYVPSLALYFRPFADSICPSDTANGIYQGGAYECDFRISATAGVHKEITVPTTLYSVYAKAWGGGGGGYNGGTSATSSAAGSGGFSGGLITAVGNSGTTNISSNQKLEIYVGGLGSGGTSATGGAGAGGSGVFDQNSNPIVVAGGGGGASFSTANVLGSHDAYDCSSVVGGINQCGLGGNGGGYGASATTEAPDQTSGCGGLGGNSFVANSGPPQTDCTNPTRPGADPSGFLGGGATAGGGGGPSVANSGTIPGGSGFTLTNKLGGGGGGGGVSTATKGGGQAGGYDSSSDGYGGGGGAGATAGTGVSYSTGEAGSYVTGGYTDTSRSGTPASGNPHDLVSITPALTSTTSPWSAGYTVSGTGIPSGTTIKKIISTTSIQLSNQVSGSSAIALTVTSNSSSATSVPGGASDFYYAPTTLPSALQTPGVGGVFTNSSTAPDGNSGAVVLIW